MLFPNAMKLKLNPYLESKVIHGEERVSYYIHHHVKKSYKSLERASVSFFVRGSVTIEAALAIPIFFFALLCMIYLLEIGAIQTSIKLAAHSACKEVAKEAYIAPILIFPKIEADIVDAIGADRLNRSIIVEGSNGVHCYKSNISPTTRMVELVVEYKVRLPISEFELAPIKFKEVVRMKGWSGYTKGSDKEENNKMVYITETGIVYHINFQCTYLQLSIQKVEGGKVADLRNDYQGKYHPCERCITGAMPLSVYITGQGNRYHVISGCSGLKRTIQTVPITEVGEKGVCTRCG